MGFSVQWVSGEADLIVPDGIFLLPAETDPSQMDAILRQLLVGDDDESFDYFLAYQPLPRGLQGMSATEQLLRIVFRRKQKAALPGWSLKLPDWIRCIQAQGEGFLVGGYDRVVREVQSGEMVKEWRGHKGSVNAICSIEQTGKIISGSADKTIRIENGQVSKVLNFGEPVQAMAIAQEGLMLAGGGSEGRVRVYRQHQAEPLLEYSLGECISGVSLCSHSIMSVACWDTHLRHYDLTTGQQTASFQAKSAITSLLGENLLGLANGTIISSSSSSTVAVSWKAHQGWIASMAACPTNPHWLVTAGYDGAVGQWDMRMPGQCVGWLRTASDASKVLAVAWGSAGIAAGGETCLLETFLPQ